MIRQGQALELGQAGDGLIKAGNPTPPGHGAGAPRWPGTTSAGHQANPPGLLLTLAPTELTGVPQLSLRLAAGSSAMTARTTASVSVTSARTTWAPASASAAASVRPVATATTRAPPT
jgi:hypothetical protein